MVKDAVRSNSIGEIASLTRSLHGFLQNITPVKYKSSSGWPLKASRGASCCPCATLRETCLSPGDPTGRSLNDGPSPLHPYIPSGPVTGLRNAPGEIISVPILEARSYLLGVGGRTPDGSVLGTPESFTVDTTRRPCKASLGKDSHVLMPPASTS